MEHGCTKEGYELCKEGLEPAKEPLDRQKEGYVFASVSLCDKC